MPQRKRQTSRRRTTARTTSTTSSRPRGRDVNTQPGKTPSPPDQTNWTHPTAPGAVEGVPGAGIVGRSAGDARSRADQGSSRGRRGAAPRTARGRDDVGPDAPRDLGGPYGSAGPAAAETADPNFSAASPRAADRPRRGAATRMDTARRRTEAPPVRDPGPATRAPGPPRAINEIMTRDVEVAAPDTELYYVARMMAERDVGAIPIVESTDSMRPVGIVTDRDITVRVIARRQDPGSLRARDAMSTDLLTVRDDASPEECIDQMEQRRVRRALVTDGDGRLVGIVAQADVARCLRDDDRAGELVREVSRPPGDTGARRRRG